MLILPNKSIIKHYTVYHIIRLKLKVEMNYRGRRRSFYSQEIIEEQKADETARSREEEKER